MDIDYSGVKKPKEDKKEKERGKIKDVFECKWLMGSAKNWHEGVSFPSGIDGKDINAFCRKNLANKSIKTRITIEEIDD